jgi:hypothetical protein
MRIMDARRSGERRRKAVAVALAAVVANHSRREPEGWFVLSPRARQIVVRTGAVEEDDPDLVLGVIRDVVNAARA